MRKHFPKVILTAFFILTLSQTLLASNTVFTQATSLLTTFMNFFSGVSHVGLAIGVGWGMLMRQFAGGDHQQVQKAEGIMKGSIIAWVVFNGLTLITNTLLPYLS